MEQFKISLKAARVNANMKQSEVAEKLNKTAATIAAWENGDVNIKAVDLDNLCTLYNVPKDYIFLG